MIYTEWTVIAGEVPTVTKWNQLGQNDDYLSSQISTQALSLPPIGAIMYYFSDGGAAPTNWVYCDGGVVSVADSPLFGVTTPNMMNSKFIRGMSNRNFRSAPANGGEDSVALDGSNNGAHTHGAWQPAHSHQMFVNYGARWARGADASMPEPVTGYTLADNYMTAVAPAVNVGSSGSGVPHNNVPGYIGQAVIMRVK